MAKSAAIRELAEEGQSGAGASPDARARNSTANLMACMGMGWWHLSQVAAFRARGLMDIELPQKHFTATADAFRFGLAML